MNQIYREMIENSPMGYMHMKVINDNRGRYIGIAVKGFNKSYKNFFGSYDENIINKYILNCMPIQEKLEWEKIFAEANESKKYTKEIYVEKINTYFNIDIYRVKDYEFHIMFNKIRNKYLKLPLLLKKSPYMTWIKDRHGVYIDVNDKFLEFFDKMYDEVIGKTDYDIMSKDFAIEFTIQDNDVIKNNKMNTYEDFIKSNFNKIGYFQTVKWPFTEDNNIILGTIGMSIEITKKVELFKNIEKNEKIFLEIANNIEDAIIIIDEEKIQYISPSFEKVFGSQLGESYNDIEKWCKNGNQIEFETRPKSYEFKESYSFTFKIKRKGKEEQWIFAKFVPLLDKNRNVVKKIGILSDITQNKKVELELEKLRMDFFANLSHELRTPINVIASSLQVLYLRMEKLDDENFEYFKKYLKIVGQNTNRLLKLVNNLIDTTRLDAGCFAYAPKNNDIISCIENICLSVSEFVESNKLSIIFDTNVEEKIISFDQDNMERIILNLISNAIKFNNPGGKIEVTVNCNDNIKISVKDSGIGIPKESLENIFKRFEQVKDKLKREKEGSGIGLTLVKSLVEMHGGSIHVNSVLGEGSEFIVTLPDYLVEEEDLNSCESPKFLSKVNMMNVEFSDIYTL
ncbi:sensor histidine kinase [Paraclostridium tenue]|uniref:histidine kinase n=1 Tax=Paraclostridium tenue TaxID=1737 RepID=A0ABN1M0X1_9FIRM